MITGPEPARTVRRRSSTRAQLISAARAVFDETGSTSASVETVVGRAGFTRGAFYSNFGSVDDLFFAVYEQLTEQMLGQLEQTLRDAFAGGSSSVDSVVAGVITGLPAAETWYSIRSVLLARALHDADVNVVLRAHTARFNALLQPLLVEALARVGREPTVDRELFTRAVAAAHLGAVSQAALGHDNEAVRIAAVKGVITGLSAPLTGRRKKGTLT